MPLKPQTKDVKGSPEWKHLGYNNNQCPICEDIIHKYNTNIEYVKTKRGTHIFIHTSCVHNWGKGA